MLTSLFILAGLQAAPVASPPPSPPPSPCAAAEFAAFDFWVGEWDVYPAGKDTLVAQSRIEKLYGGCAIRESWMPVRGGGGGSLSAYDPKTGRWHQSWVGGGPGTVYFDGGAVGDAMILTGWWPGSGPRGEDGLTRMTYSPLDGGAVRQHGEFSADQGVTWTTSFDFTYRPKEVPE